MTPEQGHFLLQITRDWVAPDKTGDAQIIACLGPVDALAADSEFRKGLEESVNLAGIAARRRTGDRSYLEIKDNAERVRMARLLAEGRWLRQLRLKLESCLASAR